MLRPHGRAVGDLAGGWGTRAPVGPRPRATKTPAARPRRPRRCRRALGGAGAPAPL
jgi:hypothetical protein